MRPDQAILANHRIVENGGTNPHQGIFANRAAMQHGLMADGAVSCRWSGGAHIRVQHATILNVAAFAQPNQFIVTTQNGVEPDTGIFAETHATDDVRAGGNPIGSLLRQFRCNTV